MYYNRMSMSSIILIIFILLGLTNKINGFMSIGNREICANHGAVQKINIEIV